MMASHQPSTYGSFGPYRCSSCGCCAAAAQEPAVRLDMFGRPVAKKAARKRQATSEASPAARSSVRVKFHEGVTNAVRRTVYVSDLL